MKLYYWTLADYTAAQQLSLENASGCVVMDLQSNGSYLAAGADSLAQLAQNTVLYGSLAADYFFSE